jgi:hypothetical protein
MTRPEFPVLGRLHSTDYHEDQEQEDSPSHGHLEIRWAHQRHGGRTRLTAEIAIAAIGKCTPVCCRIGPALSHASWPALCRIVEPLHVLPSMLTRHKPARDNVGGRPLVPDPLRLRLHIASEVLP